MSVLAAKRKLSKFEPIIYSEDIHKMLTELIQHSFGIRDMQQVIRRQYKAGRCEKDAWWKHYYLLHNAKTRIDNLASEMTSYVRGANSIYPTNMDEYLERRNEQDHAIVACEQIIKELQHVVEIFDVDLNLYKRHVQAIYREIDLIKDWRQRDNKIRVQLKGNG